MVNLNMTSDGRQDHVRNLFSCILVTGKPCHIYLRCWWRWCKRWVAHPTINCNVAITDLPSMCHFQKSASIWKATVFSHLWNCGLLGIFLKNTQSNDVKKNCLKPVETVIWGVMDIKLKLDKCLKSLNKPSVALPISETNTKQYGKRRAVNVDTCTLSSIPCPRMQQRAVGYFPMHT